ncbi:hypothetical protein OMR58_08110 [Erwinia sp. INIA-01]|uniref:hypothetical protein n=1 Tax=Erwinia sp. INIA01 TaxID=2991500 RepID=UPI002224445A|nr:hypothetical protein [Erwinia sp. INIA01]MCW1874411.1 hypothetical protein [Erwinia sp. INIA01]
MVIASSKCIHFSEVVTLVVLTEKLLPLSLIISQLLAKAIPVRGAIFREARLRKLERAFCFWVLKNQFHPWPFLLQRGY